MNSKFFKLFATSLLLALVLVSVFFVSGSPQAHAAQYNSTEQSTTTQPSFGCNPGGPAPIPQQLTAIVLGAQVLKLTPCGVSLFTAGTGLVAIFGTVGAFFAGVTIANVQAAAALSCDGGVYVYIPNPGSVGADAHVPPVAVPDC